MKRNSKTSKGYIMPFVKISCLETVPDRHELMCAVEQGLYDIQIDGNPLMPANMATCLWQNLDSIVHKKSIQQKHQADISEIPVFVDLYLNTSFDNESIALIMKSIADNLSASGTIMRDNVFIHTHIGQPGQVFISGSVTG
jgi:hypothetical protein